MEFPWRFGHNVFMVQYRVADKHETFMATASNYFWTWCITGFDGRHNAFSNTDRYYNMVFDGNNNDFLDFGDVQYI